MMEEHGIVIAVEGTHAWVETSLKSSCSHCTTTSCGTGALATHFSKRSTSIRVENSQNANPGDAVIIGLDESSVLQASALVYMLPLITLFLGAYLGFLGGDSAASAELLSITGGVIGLIAGLFMVAKTGRNTKHNHRMQAIMLKREHEQVVDFKPL